MRASVKCQECGATASVRVYSCSGSGIEFSDSDAPEWEGGREDCDHAGEWDVLDVEDEHFEGDVPISFARGAPPGTPISEISGRPGHPGFDEFCRIAQSWGYD